MRLDQFISHSGELSRREVKLAIKNLRIKVNGAACKDPATKVSPTDVVVFDNDIIQWQGEIYFMLNKPAGYCCSHQDDGYPSALQLLPVITKKLHFAGRLDADTTGLVLLSSDGQWCHRVTSPKQRCEKQKHYRVSLRQELSQGDIQTLEVGIILRGETSPTLPAIIRALGASAYNITISEGRYHQVKRMFAAVGNQVESLHRYQIANICLNDDLAPGQYRPLTADEIRQF